MKGFGDKNYVLKTVVVEKPTSKLGDNNYSPESLDNQKKCIYDKNDEHNNNIDKGESFYTARGDNNASSKEGVECTNEQLPDPKNMASLAENMAANSLPSEVCVPVTIQNIIIEELKRGSQQWSSLSQIFSQVSV